MFEAKPSPPSQLICTRLVAGYNCSWGYPDDDGGYPVTHYIYSHSATSSSPGHWVTVQASVTTALNRMLEENTSYMISVVAVNAVGDSDPTTTVILTPKSMRLLQIYNSLHTTVICFGYRAR